MNLINQSGDETTPNLSISCDLPHYSDVVSRLLSAGFYYCGQIPLYEVVEDYAESDTESYGDWQIQTYPVVAVGHRYSGHYWMGDYESFEYIVTLIDG